MHEDDINTTFEVTPEIVEIINQANNHWPAEKIFKNIKEFNQRIAININTDE